MQFFSFCSANFQSILDRFIPNFKLKCVDSQNIKADRANTVVFTVHQIKCWAFLGHLVDVSLSYLAARNLFFMLIGEFGGMFSQRCLTSNDGTSAKKYIPITILCCADISIIMFWEILYLVTF